MDFLLTFWAGLTFGQSLVVGILLGYLYILFWQIVRQAFQVRILKKCMLPESKETIKQLNSAKLWIILLKNPFLSIFSVVSWLMQFIALVFSFLLAGFSLFASTSKNETLKVSFVSLSPYDPLQALLIASDKRIKLQKEEIINIANAFNIPMVFFLLTNLNKEGVLLLNNVVVLARVCIRLSFNTRMKIDIRCGKSQEELILVSNQITKVLNSNVEKNFVERCDELTLTLNLIGLVGDLKEASEQP